MNKRRFSLRTPGLKGSIGYLLLAAAAAVSVYFIGQSSVVAQNGVAQSGELEVYAEFSAENPPGNIAITPEGRVIMSQHPFYGEPSSLKVVEIEADKSTSPFPNMDWNSPLDKNGIGLNSILGVRADETGVVWMLDQINGEGQPGRIVGWDTLNDELSQVIYLSQPVIKSTSFLNDLAVDRDNNKIYMTDTAGDESALIVIDLTTGLSRRVLEGDISTRPEDIPIVIDGRTMNFQGEPAKIGADAITIDPENEWVYYAPMSGESLYRISTKDLIDESLSAEALSSKVQRYGDKPICDGITVDGSGNVYITSITDHSIGVVEANGEYRTLYQDDRLLSWTDGMAFGADNYVYVTANQLQNSAPLNSGEDDSEPPFYVVRFPSLASGEAGR